MAGLNEREAALLTKALDGTLSDREETEFARLLERNSQVRDEWKALKRMKEATMTLTFRKPAEETWETYWAGVYARIERGLAWLLISIGGAIVLAAGIYRIVLSMLEDASTPAYMKIAVGALALGFAVLVISVLREKWHVRKSDKYKELTR